MPQRRRSLARGLTALGDVFGDVARLQLQDQLSRERQQEFLQSQQQAQLQAAMLSRLVGRAEQGFPPDAGALAGLTGLEPDQLDAFLGALTPSVMERLSPISEDITTATERSQLPTEADIAEGVRARGITPERDIEFEPARPPQFDEETGDLALPRLPMMSEVQRIMGQRSAREDVLGALEREARPPAEITTLGPTGQRGTSFVDPRQAAREGTFFPSELPFEEQLGRTEQAGLLENRLRADLFAETLPGEIAKAAAVGQQAATIQTQAQRERAINEVADAAANFSVPFNEIVEISEGLALETPSTIPEGLANVGRGLSRTLVTGPLGLDPRVSALDNAMAQARRAAAQAMGMTEAALSEAEQLMAAAGIGVGNFTTQAQRVSNLRRMRALGQVAPIIRQDFMRRLGRVPTPTEAVNEVQRLLEATVQAELRQIEVLEMLEQHRERTGAEILPEMYQFTDPSTGMMLPVIR